MKNQQLNNQIWGHVEYQMQMHLVAQLGNETKDQLTSSLFGDIRDKLQDQLCCVLENYLWEQLRESTTVDL